MAQKYVIFGATGSIGSSLAHELYKDKKDCHLVGRNEVELKKISNKLNWKPSKKFKPSLFETIELYIDNYSWWGPLIKNKKNVKWLNNL